MPRTCTICSNGHLLAINTYLSEGHQLTSIARKFRVSFYALRRHRQHVAEKLRESSLVGDAPADNTVQDRDLISKIHRIELEIDSVMREAARRSDAKLKLLAIREAQRAVELESRLTGAIERPNLGGVTVNVVGDDYRARLLAKLGLGDAPESPDVVEGR